MLRLNPASYRFLNAGDFHCDDDYIDDQGEMPVSKKPIRKRAPRQTLSGLPGFSPNKPTLVIVGESMVDPADVAAIKKIRSKTDLYIVILKSQPNMEYPLWANAAEVEVLMTHFNIVG